MSELAPDDHNVMAQSLMDIAWWLFPEAETDQMAENLYIASLKQGDTLNLIREVLESER